MILREFFNYQSHTGQTVEDALYDPKRDNEVMSYKDTRKTRLTLKQINQMRLTTDEHNKELERELSFISRMYATPSQGM